MQDHASRVPDDGAHHTVDAHATPDGRIRIGDKTFSPKEFADMMRRDPDWDGTKPVRLLSCDAGTSGLARDLSRELGVPVTAPRGLAWTDSSGRVFASDKGPDGRPGWPPNGGWDTHHPDGTTTPASSDGFHPTKDGADPGDRPDDAEDRGDENGSRKRRTPDDTADEGANEPSEKRQRTEEPNPARMSAEESFTSDPPPRRYRRNECYEVQSPDGNVRSRVHTDGDGRVTRVEAIAPNDHNQTNPEIAWPARNADYQVEVGHRHTAFATDSGASPRTETATAETVHGTQNVTRYADIQTPPAPKNHVEISRNDLRAPQPSEAFSRRTDLAPNTRYHVTDADGNSRGSFQTDTDGNVKWVDTDASTPDHPNPELTEPLSDANYRIDKGPVVEDYHINGDGQPEPRITFEPPPTSADTVHHDRAVGQSEPFNRQHTDEHGNPRLDENGDPTLAPNSKHVVTDEYGQYRCTVYTNEEGRITHMEADTGQRGRTNPEIKVAPEGTKITQDGYYGTDEQKSPQRRWPEPEREITFSHEKNENSGYSSDSDTDGLTPDARKAIEERFAGRGSHPFANREGLPPNSRITLIDKGGHPYGTFQTDSEGAVKFVHTGQPFNADLNYPPPNAHISKDDGTTVHLTDERSNTIATSAEYRPGGATDLRRDGKAQSLVGALGGKMDGKNVDDGGHHHGTARGGGGEAAGQSAQSRMENSHVGTKKLAEAGVFDTNDSWYGNERRQDANHEAWQDGDIDWATSVAAEDGRGRVAGREEIATLFDSGADKPYAYVNRWSEENPHGRITINVRSFPNDRNLDLWPNDFRRA